MLKHRNSRQELHNVWLRLRIAFGRSRMLGDYESEGLSNSKDYDNGRETAQALLTEERC